MFPKFNNPLSLPTFPMAGNSSGASETPLTRHDFPSDFLWGGATSTYQIEGAYKVDSKSICNWDDWTLKHPGKVADGKNGCVAIDHYNRVKEDVKTIKKLGIDTYRFSISWSRILPGGRLSTGVNREGVKFYNDLIDLLLAEGIKPFVTIFHFDVPQCLMEEYGAFEDKRVVQDFGEFADVCFYEFGDRVKHWVTMNEPCTYVGLGYTSADFPPGHGPARPPVQSSESDSKPPAQPSGNSSQPPTQSGNINVQLGHRIPQPDQILPHVIEAADNLPHVIEEAADKLHEIIQTALDYVLRYRSPPMNDKTVYGGEGKAGTEPYLVAHHLLLSHAKAVEIYRNKYQAVQGGKIGITNVSQWYEPYNACDPLDIEAASRAVDFQWGWFTAPIVTGDYPPIMRARAGHRLPTFTDEEKISLKKSFDFIGMNYYTTHLAQNDPTIVPEKDATYDTDRGVKIKFKYADGTPIGKQAGSAWLFIVPRGIHRLLKHNAATYGNPLVYITENGVNEKNEKKPITDAVQDDYRINYLKDHFAFMKKAIDEGVNLKGYMLWSLFDNFEWAEGYTVRFGIYYVDFVNGLTRYPKNSAIWYMNFLNKSLPPPNIKK